MITRSGRVLGAPAAAAAFGVGGGNEGNNAATGNADAGAVAGPVVSPTTWRDGLQADMVAARAARASAALAARGREDAGGGPSRPAAPLLPTDVWALIIDRAPSSRCAAPPLWPSSLNVPPPILGRLSPRRTPAFWRGSTRSDFPAGSRGFAAPSAPPL